MSEIMQAQHSSVIARKVSYLCGPNIFASARFIISKDYRLMRTKGSSAIVLGKAVTHRDNVNDRATLPVYCVHQLHTVRFPLL